MSIKKSLCYLMLCHENNKYFLLLMLVSEQTELINALKALVLKVPTDFTISFSSFNYITTRCHIHRFINDKFATSCNHCFFNIMTLRLHLQ